MSLPVCLGIIIGITCLSGHNHKAILAQVQFPECALQHQNDCHNTKSAKRTVSVFYTTTPHMSVQLCCVPSKSKSRLLGYFLLCKHQYKNPGLELIRDVSIQSAGHCSAPHTIRNWFIHRNLKTNNTVAWSHWKGIKTWIWHLNLFLVSMLIPQSHTRQYSIIQTCMAKWYISTMIWTSQQNFRGLKAAHARHIQLEVLKVWLITSELVCTCAEPPLHFLCLLDVTCSLDQPCRAKLAWTQICSVQLFAKPFILLAEATCLFV